MPRFLRQAAFLLLLSVIGLYATLAVVAVSGVFLVAIALDAIFAGWTRNRVQRLNRAALLETADLARR